MKRLPLKTKSRGAAILIVLALTSLFTVLVVTLLQTASVEKQMAYGSAGRQSAERHADTALQFVLAQLRTATTLEASPGVPAPWSSQPGGITVHQMDGSVGEIYKLYSAATGRAAETADLTDDLPVAWDAVPGQYVDLNAPAITGRGDQDFPIADPRLAGPDGAEGFEFDTPNAPRGTTMTVRPEEKGRRLPMPVRWIYLLRDGTLGVLDDTGRFTSGQGRATTANPITARIAWWADDESSKININTAGEASPWDTPRLTTEQDEALAKFQPMRGEYHRYPGHPAGVSLSSVFFPGHRWLQPGDILPQGAKALSPRAAEGLWALAAGTVTDPALTSLGGTRQPPGLELPMGNGAEKPWHLYASTGELRFAWNREENRLFQDHPEAARNLDRADFLLTTESRSPETTLQGTPRISLWPVHESVQPGLGYSSPVQRASATDTLLALCSTAGNRRYYMQRATPGDGSADFQRTGLGANATLFQWMTRLLEKPVPGFLKEGLPASFADKYGTGPESDSQNIAALMLDYIRTTNLADGAIPEENQYSIVCPGNETEGYGQISPLDTARGTTGAARWKPAQLQAARGMGRMPTVQGAVLVLTCRAICQEDGTIIGSPTPAGLKSLKRPGSREMEAAILFEGFVPGQGWAESRPYCTLVAGGISPGNPTDFSLPLPSMRVNGAALTPQPIGNLTRFNALITSRGRVPGGWTASGGATGALAANAVLFAPFVVTPQVDDGGFLQFDGSSSGSGSPPGFKVGLFDAPGIEARNVPASLGDLVQVVELNFPKLPTRNLLLPELPRDGTPPTMEDRLINAFEKGKPLLSAQDIAQSLVLAHGDSRLTAGQRLVPSSSFTAHPDYGRAPLAHRLKNEPGSTAGASSAAGYFEDIPQPGAARPDFPVKPWDDRTDLVVAGPQARQFSLQSMATVFSAGRLDQGRRGPASPAETGDFDTGSGRVPDGPYVNRADDGEVRGFAGGGVPYFDAPPSDPGNVPPVSAAASSPNRLMTGPGMFGSLPTGVKANVPWQTLLFRPWLEPVTPRRPPHYGASWPQDHLLLDLFWMPVVEPYAISTPLETAGKINLNHQLLPFRHIHRATALHALLKSERIIAVADRDAGKVKLAGGFSNAVTRHPIDATGTLKLWEASRLENARPFLSASEVCTLPLVPSGINPDKTVLASWWNQHRLTGDNLKERPYTNLHTRLTTRSNAFRVHVMSQSLQKATSTDPARWDEAQDQTVATWRGSALISRHVRAQDLPDYVTAGNAPSVDHFYSWSITSQRSFAPR